MGARNRVRIELSYRPARLHRQAELIPWNRFLGSLKVKNSGLYSVVPKVDPDFVQQDSDKVFCDQKLTEKRSVKNSSKYLDLKKTRSQAVGDSVPDRNTSLLNI